MRVFEAQVQELVRRRAPVAELYAQFGQPRHTESQASIRQRLAETSPSDTVCRLYQRMAEYPETVTIQLPDKSGDLLAFGVTRTVCYNSKRLGLRSPQFARLEVLGSGRYRGSITWFLGPQACSEVHECVFLCYRGTTSDRQNKKSRPQGLRNALPWLRAGSPPRWQAAGE